VISQIQNISLRASHSKHSIVLKYLYSTWGGGEGDSREKNKVSSTCPIVRNRKMDEDDYFVLSLDYKSYLETHVNGKLQYLISESKGLFSTTIILHENIISKATAKTKKESQLLAIKNAINSLKI
jgi:hypothetical protein